MNVSADFTQDELATVGKLLSLGDNCEFGFVQRSLGVETSSFLRWAIAKPSDVAALLDRIQQGEPLTDLYDYETIVPHSPKMVRDALTDFCFHTQIAITGTPQTGGYVFEDDAFERLKCWQKEKNKYDYLADGFQSKLSDDASTYVIKHLTGSDEAIQETAALLRQLNTGNRLLAVSEDPDRAGEVSQGPDNIMYGHVTKFAPYSAANDCDYDGWYRILRYLLSDAAK